MEDGLARQQAQQQQGNGGTETECDHHRDDAAEIMTLGRQDRGGAERRPGAGAPDGAEQQTQQELSARPVWNEIRASSRFPALLTPPAAIANRCCRTSLNSTTPSPASNYGGDGAKEVAVQPDGEADRRDEKADRDEGDDQPGSERRQPEAGCRHRRPQLPKAAVAARRAKASTACPQRSRTQRQRAAGSSCYPRERKHVARRDCVSPLELATLAQATFHTSGLPSSRHL